MLLFAIVAANLTLISNPSAHTPAWQIPTYAFISVTPDPIGVGQQLNVLMWVDKMPNGAAETNNVRFRDYNLTIIKPDGTIETKIWDTCKDTTSSQYYAYTPETVGNYTFTFTFPEQKYDYPTQSAFVNDTYLSSTASTTITVQQDPIQSTISNPLPTEYWTRPIEGQNTDWYTISSNWLGPGSPNFNNYKRVQNDGTAPNSAHIMWSTSIEDGGVVGGTIVDDGEVYAASQEYNTKFQNTIIMNGRLIYEVPYGDSETGGGLKAIDLRTGETLWQTDETVGAISFGYLYDFDSTNQHGVLKNGLIFTNNFARAYDPTTGKATTMNITKAPQIASAMMSGTTTAYGSDGEILVYEVINTGNNNYRLTQWNSSKVVFETLQMFGESEWYSGTIAGNTPVTPAASGSNIDWNGSMWVNSTVYKAQGFTIQTPGPAYDWNISLPALNGLSAPSIISVVPDEYMVGTSTSWESMNYFTGSITAGTPDPFTFWAVSLEPESQGAFTLDQKLYRTIKQRHSTARLGRFR